MLFSQRRLTLQEEELIANKLSREWQRDYAFRFVQFKAEMDTPFWHLIMKDLMERTFGPLK